ncbi:hypothetical protein KKB55_10905 [Myxococcota bacterium]|nr:hypothetical protein [Myxococcota bacterium]MBU1898245.1 hypothetical protein [Myxococcota bacterium]
MRATPLLLLLLGCDLNQLPAAEQISGDLCEQACLKASGCDYCIEDEAGGCFTAEGCAAWCRANQEEGWAECLVAEPSCEADALSRCWDLKQSRCLSTCLFLEGCGLCARDAAGECLDVAGCALACLDFDERTIDCVRAFDQCDADHINSCLSYAGSEACNASCANLNLCGRCWPDETGDCLDWSGCMGLCNVHYDDRWRCVGEAACEVIDLCYGPNSFCHDACQSRSEVCEGIDAVACLESCQLSQQLSWARCALDAEDICALDACAAEETSVFLEACAKMRRCRACFSEAGDCIEDARCAQILAATLPTYGACVYTLESCDLRPCDAPSPPIRCEVLCPKVDLCAASSGCIEVCEGWSSARRACALTATRCADQAACAALD